MVSNKTKYYEENDETDTHKQPDLTQSRNRCRGKTKKRISRPPHNLQLYPFHGYIYNCSKHRNRTRKRAVGNTKGGIGSSGPLPGDGTISKSILKQNGSTNWNQQGIFNRAMNMLFNTDDSVNNEVSGKVVRFSEDNNTP